MNPEICKLVEKRDQFDTLLTAARQTLLDNLHLCDGDNCTLKALRDAVEAVEGKPLLDDEK